MASAAEPNETEKMTMDKEAAEAHEALKAAIEKLAGDMDAIPTEEESNRPG